MMERQNRVKRTVFRSRCGMAMYDVVGYNSQGMLLEEARKFEHNK